jgi:hypothetical protein
MNASIQVATMVKTNPISAQSNSKGASTCDVFTKERGVYGIQTTSVAGFSIGGTDLDKNFQHTRIGV